MNKTTNKLRAAVIITLTNLLTCTSIFAQAPEKMSYQAVVRNSSDALVSNQQVGMQISILQGSPTGTAVYVETQTPTTNANGLVSIEFGNGTVISGTFASIDWANGPYFIKTETDPTGGTNYTITGTSQIMSVPYALHASHAANGMPDGTDTSNMLYWNGSDWVTLDAGSNGQVLTICNGKLTWTTDGNCPIAVSYTYPNDYVHCGTPQTEGFDIVNPSTGKRWMDRNLGAARVAKSPTDSQAYGSMFQWGRYADGHQCRNSDTTSTISSSYTPNHGNFIKAPNPLFDWHSPQNNNLWQGVNGINNPCPTGYRLPTDAELNNERLSWTSNNATGAFASPLKLPLAGYRHNSFASINSVGSYGYYWSSTVNGLHGSSLRFDSGNAGLYGLYRANGPSVRCLRD